MRKVQIRDNLHCDFVEYVSKEDFDETKQIDISDEDRLAIGVTKCFNLENNTIIAYDNTADLRKTEINNRIAELKLLLTRTDYKAIKYAEGIITAEEYEETKVLRNNYREEINNLEHELYELGGN